jgi:hypothetical protein
MSRCVLHSPAPPPPPPKTAPLTSFGSFLTQHTHDTLPPMSLQVTDAIKQYLINTTHS